MDNINIELITELLKFNPTQPLLFNSKFFLIFFLIFYIGYAVFRSSKYEILQKIYLVVFSMYFYYKAGGYSLSFDVLGYAIHINYAFLLLFCALATDLLARVMYLMEDRLKQKMLLGVILVGNLGMLAYFKYTGFILDNLNSMWGANFSISKIILPIGISFFVFEAISYAVDLYRKEMEPARSTLDFCFYITFFPKLVAGPIIRAKDFLPQMYNRKSQYLTNEKFNAALFLIILGLIKKAVISDYISSNFVDRIYDAPMLYSSFENLLAVYGYTLQIYCDFSGYSDIAIGLSLLMGFSIPANFNAPYKSQSITEFWRRWHISLSSWLRDYLYISLGGNRKGKVRTYINLFLTMLIGGLWHGASWKFVIWGGLHGILLAIERFMKQLIPLTGKGRWGRVIRILVTFHLVTFCWIFFRAESFSVAIDIIQNIGDLTFAPGNWMSVIIAYGNVFLLMLLGYVFHFLPETWIDIIKAIFNETPLVIKSIVLGFVIWLIYATVSSGPQPFIYFQF